MGNSKRHRLLRYIQFVKIRCISIRGGRYVPQRVCGWGSAQGPRAHEFMEQLVRRFALDKQKTTQSVQTEYNDWKIEAGEDPMSAVDRLRKIILRLKDLG